MFSIYFAALDSFATILFHFLSKYYHFVTEAFNSRCFFDFTRFIRVYNFKNRLSNHDMGGFQKKNEVGIFQY